jgi:predicted aspartyl protease
MKKLTSSLFFALFFAVTFLANAYSQDFQSVYKLYLNEDYFRLKNAIPTAKFNNKWESDLCTAFMKSVFSKFSESDILFDKVLKESGKKIHDSIKAKIYECKVVNHVNLFEYKEAFSSAKTLKEKYSQYLDAEEKEDLSDEEGLWTAINSAKPQTITKQGNAKIQMKKDMAGLWNIPVSINSENLDFVFDTGANFSVIVESLAKSLGLNLIDAKVKVGTATDIKVEAKISVCNELKIENITLHNVVFLVLPDETLDFGVYKIKGILGNPVIRAFEEIRINKNNLLTVPLKSSDDNLQNLCFSGYTPVVLMSHENDSLSLTFDSGAMITMLFKPFFNLYKKDLEGKYELVDIMLGGAGGNQKVKGYKINEVLLQTGNLSATLNKVNLLSESTAKKNTDFYGNLGQDYISQFNEMIINFRNSFIRFEN